MKLAVVASAVFVFSLLVTPCAQGQASAQRTEAPLTNAAVVKLVRAGFSEKAVIAIIRTRHARFELAPDKLIELKKSRVSEKVILAMLAREQTVEMASEDWGDDDAFFNGGSGAGRLPQGSTEPGGTEPGGMDIFGSSGGAHGRTKSRDGSGGVDTDTQTVGSASVRIMRPPTEAGNGGGTPTLEKTPTLTNDSVVELVEAGFSEGTIIRRIENSPAEFDLSAERLADLRKRRVGEPVIAAMRAAMGDGKQ